MENEKIQEKIQNYFLGLSINSTSVGYAVSDIEYKLKKFKGEPLWGVTTFEQAEMKRKRRSFRSMRRNLDRTKQRMQLLAELFAAEIAKIDKNFFLRRKESALTAKDSQFGNQAFAGGGMTDALYYKQYPTIHHLILDLMQSPDPHDTRLVYIACVWLLANRGHFLFSINSDNISDLLDFSGPFKDLCDYLKDHDLSLPWPEETSAASVESVMREKLGVKEKKDLFRDQIYGGKLPGKSRTEDFPYSKSTIVSLLSGGKVKLSALFNNPDYADLGSVALKMNEEAFLALLPMLDEIEADLLYKLRSLNDCILLGNIVGDSASISEAKVKTFEQHKADLKYLKYFIRKYAPEKYNEVFRKAEGNNYVAYSGNVSAYKETPATYHKTSLEDFSKFILSLVREIKVKPEDVDTHKDMVERLDLNLFMPKQHNNDNRLIPHQMYRYELKVILKNAEAYLPFLAKKDADGLTPAEKILSIFDFKIPYFVGPLNTASDFSWIVRKATKIYPWNFNEVIDLDATEQAFIKNMIGACTYLPWEDVLPDNSLLYQKFAVLNELNNLKINGNDISIELKQTIFTDLYQRTGTITKDKIEKFLIKREFMNAGDSVSGISKKPASLSTYNQFSAFVKSKKLTWENVEEIVFRAAFSEDVIRLRKWLHTQYPSLSSSDVIKISNFSLKKFGRLSKYFLEELVGQCKKTGEQYTIIEALWQTNENLMQLLSKRFTFMETIEQMTEDYYSDHPQKLADRLDEMYVPMTARRPIIRALDVTKDIVKVMNGAPAKIFIETSRDRNEDKKKTREKTRKQKLQTLYKQAKKNKEVAEMALELDAMGEKTDNNLRSDRIYLYFLQLGKCAYTGERIDFSEIYSKKYNIEHIYPQSITNDNNVEENLVLVRSDVNSAKDNTYPVSKKIQKDMMSLWQKLHDLELMSNEKFARLVRTTPLSDEEKLQYIMQFFEVPHSTKAIVSLLQQKYPNTEIVCINKDLVFDFRQEFSALRTVSINELYHAKDAYLTLIVGNVYYEKFTRHWFNIHEKYNIKVSSVFANKQAYDGVVFWRGNEDVEKAKKVLKKNAIHYTRYAFLRHGELFDQQPKRRGQTSLTPLKKDLDIMQYGGYDNATIAGFVLAEVTTAKTIGNYLVPIKLLNIKKFEKDPIAVTEEEASSVVTKPVLGVRLLLGKRIIKSNTVLLMSDGLRYYISGKSGPALVVHILSPLILSEEDEAYVQHIESFAKKLEHNSDLIFDPKRHKLTKEQNYLLYMHLLEKLGPGAIYERISANQYITLLAGRKKFKELSEKDQAACLQQIIALFNQNSSCSNLKVIGGAANGGAKQFNANIDTWRKKYSEAYIVDSSASGIFEKRTKIL